MVDKRWALGGGRYGKVWVPLGSVGTEGDARATAYDEPWVARIVALQGSGGWPREAAAGVPLEKEQTLRASKPWQGKAFCKAAGRGRKGVRAGEVEKALLERMRSHDAAAWRQKSAGMASDERRQTGRRALGS